MKKTIISAVVSTLLLSSSINAVDIYEGWQLKGSSTAISLDTFEDANCIDTIWTYDKSIKSWKAYSNKPDIQASIINNSNISGLDEINSYDGFWINANEDCNITFEDENINYDDISSSSIIVDAGEDKNITVNETVSLSANVDVNLIYKWFNEDNDLLSSSKVLDTNIATFDTSEVNTTKTITLKIYDNSAVLLGEDKVKINIIDSTTFNFKGLSYGEVESPYTGRIWLDRNLGASEACDGNLTNQNCFGSLYQFGRSDDGHEKRENNTTTNDKSYSLNVGNSKYILSSKAYNYDWLDGMDTNGSQRVEKWYSDDYSKSELCPDGYRVPTKKEFENLSEDMIIKLGLPYAGQRDYIQGNIGNLDRTHLWMLDGNETNIIKIYQSNENKLYYQLNNFASGNSIRCIKSD